jgi:hypothetical protein
VADSHHNIGAQLTARIARDIVDGTLAEGTDAVDLAGMVVALIQGMSVLARDGASHGTPQDIAKTAIQAWSTRSEVSPHG